MKADLGDAYNGRNLIRKISGLLSVIFSFSL